METAAACKIRERVWLETKYMLKSAGEKVERYNRFLEEKPIITTDRYPPVIERLKVAADRWNPRDHFVPIARIDQGPFRTLLWLGSGRLDLFVL